MPPKRRSPKTKTRAARSKPTRRPNAPRKRTQPDSAPPHDPEVFEVHRQFIEIMENGRLLTISAETRGHYLTVIRSLTAKLSVPGKPLSEIISEMMTEAAPLIFKVMQR